jgi:DNA repair protein SbcD/Mre11
VLGLLHADLDQPRSRHAPVPLSALHAAPVDFWLLGHIHRQTLHQRPGAASVLYPGSPQAMDPGEPGAHGPWLVEIDRGGRFAARHLPLATVRYETIEVSVAGVEEEGEVDHLIVQAVQESLRGIEAEAGPLRYLSLRVRLTGRTKLNRRLQRRKWEDVVRLEAHQGEIHGLVEQVEVETCPERDLEVLADGHDAPALLARLVGNLKSGSLSGHEAELLRRATAAAAQVRGARQYLSLEQGEDPFPDPYVRGVLGEQGLLLLDELLAGREVS